MITLFVDGQAVGEVTNLRVFPDVVALWEDLRFINNRYKIRAKLIYKYTQNWRKARSAYLKKRGAR